MKSSIRVEVTADDIKYGLRSVACGCPIARAIGRAVKAVYVSVIAYDALVQRTLDTHGRHWVLPEVATEFLRKFDDGLQVKPFSFVMHLRD